MSKISGGDKLEAALASIGERMKFQMNVGILAGATNSENNELIAPYAAANEFGTRDIPARPFMRNTVADKSGEWADTLGKLISRKPATPKGINSAFSVLGEVMVQDIRDTIEKIVPPPNAEHTVELKTKKGRANPTQTLVDSGSMQKAVNFEIITGEQE